jgi:ABC-type bacteriocin/lantibiotic exporter with double-glycine peptidase domain
VACVTFFLQLINVKISQEEIAKSGIIDKVGLNNKGTTLLELKRLIAPYSDDINGVKLRINDIAALIDNDYLIILHEKKKIANQADFHYVVIINKNSTFYQMWDPVSGVIYVSKNDLISKMTGYALIVKVSNEFSDAYLHSKRELGLRLRKYCESFSKITAIN